jgi:IS5 family transposase
LKQHPRKNKTAINIEYMKASIRAGGAPVSHHQAAVRLRESQIQGAAENNQLAMLFTLANLFRVDQMIRQWERSQ